MKIDGIAYMNVVLIATGEEKVEAIQAVLRSGCIDTLIIDETSARLVMDDMGEVKLE